MPADQEDSELRENRKRALLAAFADAKRRVLSALISLGFPVKARMEDPEQGLAFDFLESPPEGPRVLTGHARGIITVNVEEADDVKREQARTC